MITLQQIKELETKVRNAVEIINSLKTENKSLRERLNGYENKILELEEMIDAFKDDQKEIENGIIEAIKKLDFIEDMHNKNQQILNDKISSKSSDMEENNGEDIVENVLTEEKKIDNEKINETRVNPDFSEHIGPSEEDTQPEEELDIF